MTQPASARTSSRAPFRRVLLAASIAALGAVLLLLPTTASSAWTTNLVQLDNGMCGRNLQIGSDKTASSSSTPAFYIMGDGGLSKYDVFVDGTKIGNFSSDGSANVCARTTVALSEGTHTVTGTETQPKAGNALTPVPFTFTVDTVPPPAPSKPAMSSYSDSGTVGDGVTKYRGVNFTGTAPAGMSIQLYNNGITTVGGAKADANGNWSATTSQLSDGSYAINASALDNAGNRSALSFSTSITIDGTAPAAPAPPDLDPGSDTAPIGDNTTTVTTPFVRGSAGSDVATVTVYVDGVQVGTATPASGSWSYQLPVQTLGVHSVAVTNSDLADNASAMGAALSLTISSGTGGTTVPGAPGLISATSGSGVTLNWSAPASNGGAAITAYSIYRGTSAGGETLL